GLSIMSGEAESRLADAVSAGSTYGTPLFFSPRRHHPVGKLRAVLAPVYRERLARRSYRSPESHCSNFGGFGSSSDSQIKTASKRVNPKRASGCAPRLSLLCPSRSSVYETEPLQCFIQAIRCRTGVDGSPQRGHLDGSLRPNRLRPPVHRSRSQRSPRFD